VLKVGPTTSEEVQIGRAPGLASCAGEKKHTVSGQFKQEPAVVPRRARWRCRLRRKDLPRSHAPSVQTGPLGAPCGLLAHVQRCVRLVTARHSPGRLRPPSCVFLCGRVSGIRRAAGFCTSLSQHEALLRGGVEEFTCRTCFGSQNDRLIYLSTLVGRDGKRR